MAAVKAPYIGKSGQHELDEGVFGEEFHMALVHECAKAELNAKRQGTQSAKTRGEVNMTGAKAFRQKGTGRARAGALSSPQRYGGGVAFAPKPRHYVVKVNRKARKRALRAALSVHADRGTLGIADPDSFGTPSTKSAFAGLEKLDGGGRVLVVAAIEGEDGVTKSFRNLAGVTVLAQDAVGIADIIGHARLVLTPAAADHLTKLAKKDSEREEAAA
jgi:large subunit ribosomal protein L4